MSPGEDGLIGIPFPEHSNELLSHLNDQRRTGLLCDLTLTSRGARYPTHRSVMAAVSLYFRRLFGADEGIGGEGGGGFSVCQLDCVTPDALYALLEFAYTATLTIPSSGMRDVLRGAQLLGIQCVADACKDILGLSTECEIADEQAIQHSPQVAESMTAIVIEKSSRRKMDKKRTKKIGLHSNSSPLNQLPASPVSYPSPASDSHRSLSSTRPPTPEQEDLCLKYKQNKDEPGRATTMNGGHHHWLTERAHIAHPPPVPNLKNKLSEDEETEAFESNGLLLGSTSLSTSATDRSTTASSVGAGGRKRKSQTPQQCPVCQKIIHGAGKLPRHMRTHTGEKPFQCSTCGVRFTRNDKLKIHMRKHTGERPYPCPHCPARFLHSYDLKNHLSLHSGARPFECPQCHKAFAREDHLQRHRKGHSCLELRTRRPRRGPELMEDDRVDVDGGKHSNPLQALSSQVHSPAFFARAALEGGGGSGPGPSLLFMSEAERERSLALMAQLESHRLAGFPQFFLRNLEMRGGDNPQRTDSPTEQPKQWPEEEQENGEEEVEEEEK